MDLVPLRPPAALAVAEPAQRLNSVAAGFLSQYSGHTLAAYTRDLRDFTAWCARVGLDPLGAERPHIQLYLRILEEAGRAPATVARRATTLAGLYRYALEEGYLTTSPMAHLRRVRVPADSPTLGLDKTEAVALLDLAEQTSTLDHALICLLGLNGLRVSEVCESDVADLGHQRGHRTLAVTRKGGKHAVVPLAPRTAGAVEDHLEARHLGPLLITASKRRLDRRTAGRVVARLAAQVTDKRISPHSLRHTFVTLALDAGVALRDVQEAAGHADPRTTMRYDRARQSLDRHATYALAQYVA